MLDKIIEVLTNLVAIVLVLVTFFLLSVWAGFILRIFIKAIGAN